MSRYITLPGRDVYSDFRTQRIKDSIDIDDFAASYIHYIALEDSLADQGLPNADLDRLKTLLNIDTDSIGQPVDDTLPNVTEYFISPRTVSPWSSKATDIAEVCGLGPHVKRIERGVQITIKSRNDFDQQRAFDILHDRMTQTMETSMPDLDRLFREPVPAPATEIVLHGKAQSAYEILETTNRQMGLAMDNSEIDYLVKAYSKGGPIGRNPYDVELFMFAQVNSEHCRHKQFNASWKIDGSPKQKSLFSMIRETHAKHPQFVASAYSDNAAVLTGPSDASHWAPSLRNREWVATTESVGHVIKVETHNHPTAISPFAGAATGSGGEIRDEGAVGRGSQPGSALCGFSVSDLNIPAFQQPWELQVGKPDHVASSLQIMLEAPIGSASFNNEFGRPALTGFFRTLLTNVPLTDGTQELRGYHKPIMIAGGNGSVRPVNTQKDPELVPPGSIIIVLGGPAMLIGLGGGSASSVTSAEGSADLDFASVQRGNAEVQRRAQEVINACTSLGAENPILFIHDVGAGGLSNALPELCHDAGLGATFELRSIENKGCSSPMEIWCNEAQERYVMAVSEAKLDLFQGIARRERCRFSVVGRSEGAKGASNRLILTDRDSPNIHRPIDLPMDTLFGKPPKVHRNVMSRRNKLAAFDNSLSTYLPKFEGDLLGEAAHRVLQLPSVASKMFLITIGDRTVGGVTARDQLVGPWQIPVADVAVTATSLKAGMKKGMAMAMGEKPVIGLINPAASARMAIAESVCNIAAADLQRSLPGIRLSANWMSPINHPGEGAAIYEAVEAASNLCKEIGISIPVGKDSTSMKMRWEDHTTKEKREVTAPLSLVISAFSTVRDIRRTWTPQLRRPEEPGIGETVLLVVDLAKGNGSLGGSALCQVFGELGNDPPDLRDVQLLIDYFDAIEQLHESGVVLAYHDVSDGGLFTTIVEMMFAGRCGVQVLIDDICKSNTAAVISALFCEELSAVFQVRKRDIMNFTRCFATCGPPAGLIKNIGRVAPGTKQDLAIYHGVDLLYRNTRAKLQRLWSSTSHQMQRLRDNPACADEESKGILDDADPGLSYNLTFDPSSDILPLTTRLTSQLSLTQKPRVAILREQGINGAAEMAFAFQQADFAAVDVHMTDLISGHVSLSAFVGLAACGGFSYGDVLGAGRGWASSVALNSHLRQEFQAFFNRPNTFSLGVCNGCQFLTQLAQLGGIIPGTEGWPVFVRNTSEQFEARFSMVEVLDDVPSRASVFLHGMKGSRLPIAVSHGEGRACFTTETDQQRSATKLVNDGLVALRYVNNSGQPTDAYPSNPNGSPFGIAGVLSQSGRVLATMPHPERTIVSGIGSWIPLEKIDEWGEVGPWSRLFKSARKWVG